MRYLYSLMALVYVCMYIDKYLDKKKRPYPYPTKTLSDLQPWSSVCTMYSGPADLVAEQRGEGQGARCGGKAHRPRKPL